MYIVRFNKEAFQININNQYSSLELTSPVYFSNSTCHISPSQQTDVGVALASFGIASSQKDVKGALLYKLQRKYATGTDNYLNSSTVPIKNAATNLCLLVVWNITYDDHKFYVCLLKCTDDFTWDEDKLWALCHQYNDQIKAYEYIVGTWSIHGGQGMQIKREVIYSSDYRLNIIIYERARKYNMNEPMRVDSKRLVLPLTILIVLICAVSLHIQPSFKLNIHNQCWNVGLVSPIYVAGDGLECHRPPDYKAYTGDIMRSGFIINKLDDTSCGVLIYKLQRRRTHESTEIGKDTLNDVYLLVVWRVSGSKELYADVLLMEHTKALTWGEGRLNKLYYKNHNRLKKCTDTISDTWSMDDNMILKMTFSARSLKGNPELSISISEERDEHARRPFNIDLTR
jgi:hypothetical protein